MRRRAGAPVGRAGAMLAAAIAALAPVGCGDGSAAGSEQRLTVFAASSLAEPLEACVPRFEGAEVRLSLAGSDALAAQIRRGAEPDVYAAADTALPEALHAEGLVGRPLAFAANALVLAVPRDSRVRSLADLARSNATLAVGAATVPIGAYTRALLARLPIAERRRIVGRVRSEEPDARGIVGKLVLGAVGAGFAYATDVRAAGDDLREIPLPARLGPRVAYAAAVVGGAERPGVARRFVRDLAVGDCAEALRAAGFGPAPAPGAAAGAAAPEPAP